MGALDPYKDFVVLDHVCCSRVVYDTAMGAKLDLFFQVLPGRYFGHVEEVEF